MVGPTCFRFLPKRFLGGRVTTESFPSLPRSTCLPSANALLIDSRTVSRASLACVALTPVSRTTQATNLFLVILGIVTYEGLVAWDLGSVSPPALNRHSICQHSHFFMRTVIVYRLKISPVTPCAVSSECSKEF